MQVPRDGTAIVFYLLSGERTTLPTVHPPSSIINDPIRYVQQQNKDTRQEQQGAA
jgi:hypothetical protein